MKQNYVTVTICIAISYNDFYLVKRSLITVDQARFANFRERETLLFK